MKIAPFTDFDRSIKILSLLKYPHWLRTATATKSFFYLLFLSKYHWYSFALSSIKWEIANFLKGLAWSSQAQQNWSGSSFGGKRFWLRRVGSARWTPVGLRQEPPNGLREAKSPPNTPTPDGPWAPCLLAFSLFRLRRALASFRMP